MSSVNARVRTNLMATKTRLRSKLQEISRGVLVEISYRLVSRSPVGDPTTWKNGVWPKGYIPGHFINNWQVGIDAIPKGIIKSVDPSGSDSLVRMSKMGRWTYGHVYYFANNLPYARALENGWSRQAPRGMVALTMMEFPAIVRMVESRVVGATK